MNTAPSTEPTITEFLLERIAEDESIWRDGTRMAAGPYVRFSQHMLAECEAKRRIVVKLGTRLVVGDEEWGMARFVLGNLATAYSEHPDYRSEWAA